MLLLIAFVLVLVVSTFYLLIEVLLAASFTLILFASLRFFGLLLARRRIVNYRPLVLRLRRLLLLYRKFRCFLLDWFSLLRLFSLLLNCLCLGRYYFLRLLLLQVIFCLLHRYNLFRLLILLAIFFYIDWYSLL